MTLGHIRRPRRFKPTGKGGGSRKGKPQSKYPLVFVVVASALEDRAKGSHEARLTDRASGLSRDEFARQLDQYLPGWEQVLIELMPGRSTDRATLLKNRPYKRDIYSGTSDRGPHHDPRTRAAVPNENWRRRLPADHPLIVLYEQIRRNEISAVSAWQDRFLEAAPTLF